MTRMSYGSLIMLREYPDWKPDKETIKYEITEELLEQAKNREIIRKFDLKKGKIVMVNLWGGTMGRVSGVVREVNDDGKLVIEYYNETEKRNKTYSCQLIWVLDSSDLFGEAE